MPSPAYPAARAVATRVHEHFARHLNAAHDEGLPSATPLVDVASIETLIDAAFWASLRHEEGYVSKIPSRFSGPKKPSIRSASNTRCRSSRVCWHASRLRSNARVSIWVSGEIAMS